MSAAARAEARRKAILSRGSDRLAKLTTSARGEDAPAYMHDDPPLPTLRTFVGEETNTVNMPTPPPLNRTPSNSSNANTFGFDALSDPSVWSAEQQQQFIQALMGGAGRGEVPPGLPPSASDSPPILMPPGFEANPFMSLLNGTGPAPGNSPFPGMNMGKAPQTAPKSTLQVLLPLIHFAAVWGLLLYFAFWMEPKLYSELGYAWAKGGWEGLWNRWSNLNKKPDAMGIAGVGLAIMPFFYAFTTLQIILHSVRIFTGVDTPNTPTLLALALPHLPPTLGTLITTGLKWLQMGGAFLDDIAAAVFGVGVLVWLSSWLAARW